MVEVFRILFHFYLLTSVFGQSAEPSSHEVDILWQKYGEIRGTLEILKVKGKYDRKRLKDAENEIAVLKSELEILKSQGLSIPTIPYHQEENIVTTTSVFQGTAHEGMTSPWTVFPIKLLKGSIEVKADSVVFSVDVSVKGGNLRYFWYSYNRHILAEDPSYSIREVQTGNTFQLTLTSVRPKSEIEKDPIVLWLLSNEYFMSTTFNFTNETKHVTYTDDMVFRITLDSMTDRNTAITGHFMSRYNNFRNRKVEGIIRFFGLNETSGGAFNALSVYGFNHSGPWKEDIKLTNYSIWNDEFQMDWMLSKQFTAYGGILVYTVQVQRFDDLFQTMSFHVDDHNSIPFSGFNFPQEFLAIFYDTPEYTLISGRQNTIRCTAMGNPLPEVSILQRDRNDRLVPTKNSFVMQRYAPLVSVYTIIKATTNESNVDYECVAKTATREIRRQIKTKVMVPSTFGDVRVNRTGNIFIISLSVIQGDPPKPALVCYENSDGESIYGLPDVYTSSEASTDLGYDLTIRANFTGMNQPPNKLKCLLKNRIRQDNIIVHLQ